MVYTLFPLVITLVSLAVILIIVGRRFSQLSLLDVESLPEVKEEKKKDDFLRKRVEAKAKEASVTRHKRLRPVFEYWKKIQQAFRKYVGQVERAIMHEREKSRQEESPKDKRERQGEVQSLVAEAAYAEAQGDYQGAEKKYIAAIRLDTKYPDAYRGLAEVYRKQGQLTEAKETYQFLLQLDPNDDTIPARTAEVFAENGEIEKAIQYYEKAVLLNPNIPQRFLRLSELMMQLQQYPTALEAIRQALELEAQNPKYLDMLTEISIMVGNKEEAKAAWEELRRVNPDNQKLDMLKDKIEHLGEEK